jgi:DNA-binding LacI/PurR family transcriptional regulator
MGCKMALQQLIDTGSCRPVIITGPEEHYFSKVMQAAVKNLQDKFETVEMLTSDYTSQSGREIVSDLIARSVKFDGIFANDTLCLGAFRAIKTAGLKIPEDIRIVGFDDLPVCEFLTPSLTSISIDKQQLGSQAVKSLVELVRGQSDQRNTKITINATLIKRESA